MSVTMFSPSATNLAAAPMQLQTQYATPVNAVMEMAPVSYAQATPRVSLNGTVTTLAAPAQYTSMAAPMMTTMAAPMTTMATPRYVQGGSISAPIMAPAPINFGTSTVEYVQAPVAQPVMTMMQAPSYVQAPAPAMTMMQAPPALNQGPPPASLTQGIPTPDQIGAQKTAYASALDKQLADGIVTIQKETEIEKSMVKFTADKQLALMQMQIEEQRNEQIALLDEQATIRQCELKKAFVERSIQLDNQANGFTMDYQMKFIQTELAQKQYAFQQTYGNAERALEAQYNQEVAKANSGTTYSVPAQAVAAAPAK